MCYKLVVIINYSASLQALKPSTFHHSGSHATCLQKRELAEGRVLCDEPQRLRRRNQKVGWCCIRDFKKETKHGRVFSLRNVVIIT